MELYQKLILPGCLEQNKALPADRTGAYRALLAFFEVERPYFQLNRSKEQMGSRYQQYGGTLLSCFSLSTFYYHLPIHFLKYRNREY